MRPRSTLVVFLFAAVFAFLNPNPTAVLAAAASFDFPSFTLRNFTLLGDAFLRNGVVGLTRATSVPSSSVGAVIYNQPISLFDISSNTSSSFSTRFDFFIDNVNPTSFAGGDGLAFFLSPVNATTAIPGGGYLGLGDEPGRFVAVEFDTRLDPNHVGLDLDSTVSVKTVYPILQGIDLKSGNSITAWIDYKSDKRVLFVSLSYSIFKPEKPILSVDVDLSDHFKGENMYVGFSASTEGSTELHQIENWSFQTFGFLPKSQQHPHSVSDSSVTTMGNPKSEYSSSSTKKHHDNKRILLAIAGPVFFCLLFLSVLGYISVKKKKRGGLGKNNKSLLKTEFVACPREFSYKELKLATRGFHPSRIIGYGSFGTVYKGFFTSSGTIAAVKKSRHSSSHEQGETEFLAELSIIAGLRHKNLVQLQGWCVAKGELLLVYDFMPYGSLDKILHQESEEQKHNLLSLNWSHRVNILIGVASALSYLHQECEQRVIHRDIKTGNILLDMNFNPRLGDFGLAKLMDHDKSPVSTLTAGTMGYLAPEYLQYGKATEKTDVFSYGVVVLEVACGRRPIERDNERNMVNLIDWVWRLHSQGKIIEAADKRLKDEFEEEEMRKMLLLGLCCANPDSNVRPSMRRVLQILENEAEILHVPKVKPTLSFSSGVSWSIEDIVSDADEEFHGIQDLCEIKIN